MKKPDKVNEQEWAVILEFYKLTPLERKRVISVVYTMEVIFEVMDWNQDMSFLYKGVEKKEN
jgi:hypothetical protein